MQVNLAQSVSQRNFIYTAKDLAFPFFEVAVRCQVENAQNHIFGGAYYRLAVSRKQQVFIGQHQFAGFFYGVLAQGDVYRHLVAVKVGVKGGTYQRMQPNGAAFYQQGFKGLNTQAVQRGGAVEHDGARVNNLFQHFPHFRAMLFQKALGALNVVGVVVFNQLLNDKGAEEFQRHFFGDTGLMQFQLRAYHNYRTTGIVYALTQQVAPKTPLLAFEHIAQALQFTASSGGDGFTARAIVNERVYRFLQHTFFIAHNHVGRAQIKQAFQAIIAVDNAAIEVVQVAGGKAAAVQLNHRAQVRGDNRQHGQDHPFRAVAAAQQAVGHFQALDGFFSLLFGASRFNFRPQFSRQFFQIEVFANIVQRFGAHTGVKNTPPAIFQVPKL